MPRRDLVRIVLVGDGASSLQPRHVPKLTPDGVGKSSIITSLIKESFVHNVCVPRDTCHAPRFSSQVQHVVPEVTIPPEVTPENVTTSIVDTSCAYLASYNRAFLTPANPKSRPHLLTQLSRAHVICLVYSISEPSSFERVAEYWLPLFRREGINVGASKGGSRDRLMTGTGYSRRQQNRLARRPSHQRRSRG